MISAVGYAVVIWLFVVAAYGIVTSRHLVHLVLCLSVCQASTYVFLLLLGYREHATAPIADGETTASVVDPIVQALVLTDIVVGATVYALLLALTVQAKKRIGTVDPKRIRELRG